MINVFEIDQKVAIVVEYFGYGVYCCFYDNELKFFYNLSQTELKEQIFDFEEITTKFYDSNYDQYCFQSIPTKSKYAMPFSTHIPASIWNKIQVKEEKNLDDKIY